MRWRSGAVALAWVSEGVRRITVWMGPRPWDARPIPDRVALGLSGPEGIPRSVPTRRQKLKRIRRKARRMLQDTRIPRRLLLKAKSKLRPTN